MLELESDGGSSATTELLDQFNEAVNSGDAHSIAVELEALEAFYGHLGKVEAQLESAVNRLSGTALDASIDKIVGDVDNFLDGQSIPGVEDAVRNAQNNLSGSGNGLYQVMKRLHMTIRKNMWALYDTYTAYLQADEDGSQGLSTAADNGLGKIWTAKSLNPAHSSVHGTGAVAI